MFTAMTCQKYTINSIDFTIDKYIGNGAYSLKMSENIFCLNELINIEYGYSVASHTIRCFQVGFFATIKNFGIV